MSVVVRISKNIHDNALRRKEEMKINYMDKKGFFSFLIEKGIQKVTEEWLEQIKIEKCSKGESKIGP